jgi:hypothetical protein
VTAADWLRVFEQVAPWIVVIWFARKTTHDMRFLERQLEHLTEAAARLASRETPAKDVQALAVNKTPPVPEPPEPEPEPAVDPQPLPVARARYRDE